MELTGAQWDTGLHRYSLPLAALPPLLWRLILIVHGPIVILVPTRRTKDDCCELIAHKVEIENLYDNLSVGVAFGVFFRVKVPEMTFEIPTWPTKCALNMFSMFCSLIYYERREKFFCCVFYRQSINCSEFNQSRARKTQQ